MPPNVFSALAEYGDRAAESFITESLVFVTRVLPNRDLDLGLGLVNLLACQAAGPWFTSPDTPEITTQVSTEVGTPHIELRQGDAVVHVEMKHDSPLSPDQLEGYTKQLDQFDMCRNRLVLLTRSRYSEFGTSLEAVRAYMPRIQTEEGTLHGR